MVGHASQTPPWLRWGPVVAVAGLLLAASLVPVPAESIPEEAGTGDSTVSLFALLHVLGYATLAAVAARAALARAHDPPSATGRLQSRPRWQLLALVFLTVTAYGAVVELLQGVVPYRFFSYTDIALNALGGALGVVCVAIGVALSERVT